jgi:tetratricopeptide (TPR) repeat protein
MKNSISFSASPFDLPVLILAAVYITSSILQTPNKMEAYFLPGTATAVVSAVLLFFVINQMPKKAKGMIYYLLFISAALAAVAILLATTGVFKSLGLPAYIQAQNFTTLGGPLVALVFLVATLPLGLSLIVKTRQTAQKAFFGVALGLIVLSSAITLFNSLPGKPGGELPGFTVSWFVAVDSLKQSPLLGVGPGNYTTAFNRFRPISYNSTPLWASRFSTAQSFFLTAVTETGLAGVAAFLTMAYFLFKLTRERVKASKNLLTTQNASLLSLLILGVALLVFPATPALLFTFFIFLALANRTTEVNLGMFTGQSESAPFAARLPVIIAALPIIIVVVFYTVQATRVLSADITYKKALEYVVINDGRGAYDTLQQAINTNPYVDRYRITYAQINIALANSIAQKEEVTEDDRNTIAQLVQQAIREGKVAVALNPTRAGNWEMLASIYRAIMPLAQGADAFAVQTYAQAVALDPLNLNTRIALGGIYYAAEAYEDAIDVFKLAVAAKPNHANAHYNLAVAYRENGNLDRAISEMSTVLSLVSRDSDDYTVASQALADLQDKKQAEIGESENLTPPPSGELPGLEPPLDLPEEAEPPEPVATPSPSPEASPTSPAGGPTPTPLP